MPVHLTTHYRFLHAVRTIQRNPVIRLAVFTNIPGLADYEGRLFYFDTQRFPAVPREGEVVTIDTRTLDLPEIVDETFHQYTKDMIEADVSSVRWSYGRVEDFDVEVTCKVERGPEWVEYFVERRDEVIQMRRAGKDVGRSREAFEDTQTLPRE